MHIWHCCALNFLKKKQSQLTVHLITTVNAKCTENWKCSMLFVCFLLMPSSRQRYLASIFHTKILFSLLQEWYTEIYDDILIQHVSRKNIPNNIHCLWIGQLAMQHIVTGWPKPSNTAQGCAEFRIQIASFLAKPKNFSLIGQFFNNQFLGWY